MDHGVTDETAETVGRAGGGMTDGGGDCARDGAGMKVSDDTSDDAGGGPGRNTGDGTTDSAAADEGTGKLRE